LNESLDVANTKNITLTTTLTEYEAKLASLEDKLDTVAEPDLSPIVTIEPEASPVIDMSEYIKRDAEEVLAQ
jgi:hypothetical protein